MVTGHFKVMQLDAYLDAGSAESAAAQPSCGYDLAGFRELCKSVRVPSLFTETKTPQAVNTILSIQDVVDLKEYTVF